MGLKLICEVIQEPLELIVESQGDKQACYIQGIFMQADIKNRNGRLYPVSVLESEVNRYNQEYIKANRAYGELGHPAGPTINLDRVSHMFKDLHREGNNFVGKAKIMTETPNGKIVKALLDEGANLGVSSRGMGSLKLRNGLQEVQSDYRLATAGDIVADPSAPQAFVQGIMEGVSWIEVDGAWVPEYMDRTRDTLKKASKAELEEKMLAAWTEFLRKVQN